jgi:hypothetical protein
MQYKFYNLYINKFDHYKICQKINHKTQLCMKKKRKNKIK